MKTTLFNRVPPIVLTYWIIKIAATTLGETGADVLSYTLHLGYTASSLIFLVILGISFTMKLSAKKYTPILYWVTFTATSLAGTSMSDYMDRKLSLGYTIGSAILLGLLLATLWVWNFSEKSLSVEKVYTNKTELYYWLAFLISNTLGTALGDFFADDLGFGFTKGALIIGGLLAITALLHFYTKISSVLLFWIAFVLTRPFGATFGDFLTKPIHEGGLNLGTIGSSLLFVAVLIYLVSKEHKLHLQALTVERNNE